HSTPGCEVAAFCDVDRRRQGDAARISDRARFEPDFRKLLEDGKNLDAVVIATPTHWNTFIAFTACTAGKHVYVEAPVSHNVAETKLLTEVSRRYQRVIQAGTQLRSREELAGLRGELDGP